VHADAGILILAPDGIDGRGVSLEVEEFDDHWFGGWGRDRLVKEDRAEAEVEEGAPRGEGEGVGRATIRDSFSALIASSTPIDSN
jgi:hypothetical protein